MSRRRTVSSLLAVAACAASASLPACGSASGEVAKDPLDVAPPTSAEIADAAKDAPAAPRPDPRSTSRVLAYLNGEVIGYRDVLLRVGPQISMVEDPAVRARIERRELVAIVRDRLVQQAAEDAGIEIARDDIDAERALRVRELAQSGGSLDAYLAERGMTRRELDEAIRRNLRAQQYLRAAVGLGGKAAIRVRAVTDTFVTPGEVRKFYDRNPGRFHEQATARVRVLAVKADLLADDREAAVAAARARAEALRARLVAGEDFVPVFREANADVPDPNDGLREIRDRGQDAAWIEEFAFERPRGEISEVLQPRGGPVFYVLRAEGVSPERQRPFDEAQREIEQFLTQQRRAIATLEVELSLLEEAVIRPEELAAELRDQLSTARRQLVADAGF